MLSKVAKAPKWRRDRALQATAGSWVFHRPSEKPRLEPGCLRHAVRGPGRIPHEIHLDVLDAFGRTDESHRRDKTGKFVHGVERFFEVGLRFHVRTDAPPVGHGGTDVLLRPTVLLEYRPRLMTMFVRELFVKYPLVCAVAPQGGV